jgi:RNA-directed DNA polymerase
MKSKEKKIILEKGEKLITIQLSKQLQRFTEKNKNTDHINHKIFHLLHDPFTFVNAYTKISKNAGALTEGHEDDGEMKYFGLEIATKIAKKIKKNWYKFKPVKRIWVPKPGKKTKRPIDVPSQVDCIVQEAVRGVLEAIYEPVFEKFAKKTKRLSNNYGFRPRHSVWMAIEVLKDSSQKCNIAIEGDIVSAYNNLNHEILMELLMKRVTDKKILETNQRYAKKWNHGRRD